MTPIWELVVTTDLEDKSEPLTRSGDRRITTSEINTKCSYCATRSKDCESADPWIVENWTTPEEWSALIRRYTQLFMDSFSQYYSSFSYNLLLDIFSMGFEQYKKASQGGGKTSILTPQLVPRTLQVPNKVVTFKFASVIRPTLRQLIRFYTETIKLTWAA